METEANHVLSKTKELPTSSKLESLPPTDRRLLVMATLWERMAEMFGNTWALNYGAVGSKSMQTWTAGLAGYSEDQIRKGVEQCCNWDNSFPPNLGQFAKLCLTKVYTPLPPSKIKKITDLAKPATGDSAIAKREKSRMRAIERGEDVESHDESMQILSLHARWGA